MRAVLAWVYVLLAVGTLDDAARLGKVLVSLGEGE